jgi:O-antigen ligase
VIGTTLRRHPYGLLAMAAVGVGLLAAVSIPGAVGAVLFVLAIGSGRRHPATGHIAGVAALTAPVFVDIEDGSIRALSLFSPPASDEGLTLHIAVAVVPVFLVMAVITRSSRKLIPSTREGGMVSVLIVWLTVSALVGQVTHANTLGLAYYAQTVVPMLAFYLGSLRVVPVPTVMRTIATTVFITACVIVLSVVAVENHGDFFRETTNRLAWAIPQYRSYFPGVVAIAVCFAVARFRASWRASLAMLVAGATLMPLMWSRAGVLVILSAGLISAALSSRGKRQAALVVAVGIVVCIGILAVVTERGVIGHRLDVSTYQGDLRRAELAGQGFGYVLDNPILGRTFKPEWDVLSGGQDAGTTRLFGSHNQVLEYGLRGGLPALVLSVLILARAALGACRASRDGTEASAFHAAVAATVIAMTIGSMFQLYFTQPYTGSLVWFLIGMSSRMRTEGLGVHLPRQTAPPVRSVDPATKQIHAWT